MPDYDSRWTNINNSTDPEVSKLENINALNNELISKLDLKIQKLEDEKSTNPGQLDAIEKDIENIEKIKQQKQNEIDRNLSRIEDLEDGNSTTASRAEITVESLMPDYVSRLGEIESSDASESDKLKQQNGVHNDLISAIDNKILELNTEKSQNSDQADLIDKDIEDIERMKTAKLNEINQNNNRIAELGTTASDNTNNTNRAEITVESLMPDYMSRLGEIENGDASESDKLKQQNGVHNDLISAIDKKVAELNAEKSQNPDQADLIDKDIENIERMKTAKLNEINQNNNRIAELGTTASDNTNNTDSQADRQAVTIESIMPDYEERKLAIENSGADELTQLEEKMALNKELMAAIDAKNDDFETEKSNNPEQANAIDKDIESLADIRKRTENENQSFSSQIESLTDVALTNGSDTKSLNEIETSDFKAPENQESLEELNDNLADIETLEAEIEVLERSKEEAGSDKEKAKIEKEISARKLKLAVVENNTLEQLAEMNENEFESSKEEFNKNSAGVRSSDPSSTDLASANEDLKTAEQKMNQAADIRDEASNTKDPIEKNEKLKEAFELEEEAKSLVKGANRKLKAAIVTYEYANKNGEEVILEVPENPEDRQSTQYANTADELDQKAADLEERAATLRDSSETVKKKYRQAILEEATALDEEAAELKTEADQMRAKGAELKEKEDAVAAVLPERTNKQVDEETKNEVASSDDYKEYKDLTDSGDKKMEEARELDEEIKNLKDKQARKIKMAIVTYESSEEAKSAVENDPEVKALQDEINQLQKKQEDLKNGAIEDYTKAQESIADKGPEDQENIRALASQGVEPTENTNNDVAVTEPGQADFKAPEAVNNDIFRTTNDAVYSERAPIPVDEKSSGLVYKVQVGAFRNPLPQDHFDRFAPISGEKLNNGITRYMAGYFTKFNSANDARNQIRGLGYGDAFVVAYCNGERISVSRARQIENGEIECIGTAGQQDFVDNGNNTNNTNTTDNNNNTNDGGNNNTSNDNSANNNNDNDTNNTNNNTADNNNSTDTNANDSNGGNDNNNAGNNDTANNNANNNSTNNATSNNNDSNYYNSVDGAAPADQVEDIKGLFFTVQIGVYSKPVPPSTLYNIKPLNSQLISGGRIRYTTGKYTSVESATGRKNEIVGIGISDAFVTAYYDGQRISIQQARDILARDGNKALYDSPENQSGAVTTNDVENKGPFIVEVGYFEEGDVPQDFTDLLEENQDEKFLSQTDFDDNVLYYAGPFDTKEEADAKRAELQGKGFTVAEVKPVQGQDDPDFATDNNNSNSSYVKEGVYYRILVGKFADAVPGEYATLLIQTENLFDTEQDIEGNTYMYSTKIEDFDEVRERIAEFADLGIEDMQIVSYYKYEPIPKEQADAILNDEEVGELTPYEAPQGISADEYLYQTEAIYYRVRLGRFDQEVPSDFANNILMHSEDESIEQEETFEGEIIFYSLSKKTYTEIEADKARLVEKGFVDSKIVAFHKYDQISVEKARKLLGQ
jgi:hypothetical protein